jgi:hypothetical protein
MKKMFYLMLLFMVLGAASMTAQVRIGDTAEPTKGAVLDLNNTAGYKGGLLLPKVSSLTTGVADFSTEPTAATDLVGLIVYNTENGKEGVYIWTGTVNGWVALWKKTN